MPRRSAAWPPRVDGREYADAKEPWFDAVHERAEAWAARPAGNRRMADDRKPESVYGVVDEPDPRFSLANERTALSWMRTALALVAGGIAMSVDLQPDVAGVVRPGGCCRLPRWRSPGRTRRGRLGARRASPPAAQPLPHHGRWWPSPAVSWCWRTLPLVLTRAGGCRR